MKHLYPVLKKVTIFNDIDTNELESMLKCLGAQIASYKKGELLLSAGSKPENIGVLLSGRVLVLRENVDGNRTILFNLAESDLFAEALCCAGVSESPVSVLAVTDVSIMLLGFSRILHSCPNSCAFHQKLIANMLKNVAQKNLFLQNRLELVRAKSVRDKVLGYLGNFAQKRGNSFTIPLNREEMSDYLCVERSALSHELMRMKREGLIDYNKNVFTLL